MRVELINTGSELMLGAVLNSHQQWLGRQFAEWGQPIERQVAVADTADAICRAAREALSRADLVITTGGLGPTADDLTREAIAEMLGRPLQEDVAVLAEIADFFRQRNRPMAARNRVQAQVPAGAIVLHNPNGTAPGLALEVSPNPFRAEGGPSWLVVLPGPPRELQPMFRDQVLPLLSRWFPRRSEFVCRTLRTTGLGESALEAQVAGGLADLCARGLELGYCARVAEVDIRLVARETGATALVAEAESRIRAAIGKHIFSDSGETLEQVVVKLLGERGATLALAESCTGGCIGHRLTNVPGASRVVLGGVIAYSDAAKQSQLGVPCALLAEHGAVSEAVARAMAEGARERFGASHGLAVTGIAGPTGGTAAKPVGTVYLALTDACGTLVIRQFNPVEREAFKFAASQQALDLLRRRVVDAP